MVDPSMVRIVERRGGVSSYLRMNDILRFRHPVVPGGYAGEDLHLT